MKIINDLLNYMVNNVSLILNYGQTHFSLIFSAVVISLLLWIPLGIFISRNEKWSSMVLGIANTLFCIPSLALFAIFVTLPFLGLGRKSALLALVLYAMMPMVINVYQGIKVVDKNVIEAAKGMGMNSNQILKEIQLPLAAPVMFAGVRITVVMATGIAAIAAYIGERNLGRLITEGLTRSNTEMILTGAILIAIIAIFLDTVLGSVEKALVPKGLKIDRSN
ncbi:MAG: ABC transporter permease [Syntrophaceticus sp.]|nr:ABC transporter permease [Syntrophaceticus sp.]MDD4783576.1 ABC transporter permease [Syntrophaceticus sp.]